MHFDAHAHARIDSLCSNEVRLQVTKYMLIWYFSSNCSYSASCRRRNTINKLAIGSKCTQLLGNSYVI